MKRELTIDEIERQGPNDPIWVINTTGDHPRTNGQTGELTLEIPIQGAPSEKVKLPASWLPFCLTNRVPRKHLLETPLLRRHADEKLIKFITPEYARVLSTYEGADEERAEIAERQSQITRASSARTLEDTPVKVLMEGEKDPRAAKTFAEHADMEEGITRNKRAPDIPDSYLSDDAPEAPTSVASFQSGSATSANLNYSSEFNSWVLAVSSKTDIETLNRLRLDGKRFKRAEVESWAKSGALKNKPKTLASVQRTLSRTAGKPVGK